jgi:predicted PurR-regulated permease PerM
VIGPAPLTSLRDRAIGIVATGTILAILYFARDVLLPITLAVILSLLLSPLVRVLRHLGIGRTASVLVAVLVLTLSCASVAAMIGVQVARMATGLPLYEKTIRYKMATLNEMTVDRLTALTGQAERIIAEHDEHDGRDAAGASETSTRTLQKSNPATRVAPASSLSASSLSASSLSASSLSAPSLSPTSVSAPSAGAHPATAAVPAAPIPVELHQPPLSPLQVMEKVVGSVWVPLETAGIVLVVLVFVLLEHESLRDRFIRIAGGTDLRATTLALNDAGERLSRFFVSQFAVNLGVGVALWIGLTVIGLPHALLWGAFAAALRFVPYIGIWIAALFSAVLAAAVVPGWSLAIYTLSLFVTIELIAAQLVEPQLYGHTTGLSPLSVVVAAIFWSWLWGPVGLIVSTPLTLCLVVAGRHIKALSLLDILLGDTQALTMPERFYQRALSADSDELIGSARVFLKHNSLAAYCDLVVMPALRLAALDLERGAIRIEQQLKVRSTIVSVIAAIGGAGGRFTRRRNAISVLDHTSAGRQLRQQREQLTGRWQGPLIVPPGSVMLCVSLGSILDDLATELLVRILRERQLDARHLSLDDLLQVPPPEALPGSVSVVYMLSAFPGEERQSAESAALEVRRRFPEACLVTVFLPGMPLQPGSAIDSIEGADKSATSLGEAFQWCLDWLQERNKS